jgi:hypothetical protein
MQTYTVVQTGYYAVIVTSNGCVDTTTCKLYSVNPGTGTITVPGDSTVTTGLIVRGTGTGLTIYPNPNSGVLMIKTQVPENFELLNTDGKVVLTISVAELQKPVSCNGLADGIYFLRGRESGIQKKVILIGKDD